MDQNIKKKRGRKPKENTIINNNPVFAEDTENIDNLIIKLKYEDNDNNIILSINDIDTDNNFNKKKNNCELCWNCCHQFNKNIVGLPIRYNNKRFYTVGDFCSLECAARYAYDNYNNIYEIINIINLYNNIILNNNSKINMAPNRLVLKKFGGNINIDEYRNNNKNNIYNINLPIIIHLNKNISKYEDKYNDKSNLLLYRKNNTDKNIFKNLN
tara:strand:- start:1355 stop:1993 length:639 start_codon:yes stop_codon:yes gene_type:complete